MRPRRLPLEALEPYLLPRAEPGKAVPPIDWAALFGNPNPVEIEVGVGKGLFLLNAASARPDTNFFGVEIARKYQLYAATRVARRGLTNVRLACADAHKLLRESVGARSVNALHVYFPDPWWKKRHHKRRLFTPEFAAMVLHVLREGGRFHVVTDVEEYFAVMEEIVAGLPAFAPLPPPPPTEPRHDLDYLTNFERKFRKEGKPIHRASFEKKST